MRYTRCVKRGRIGERDKNLIIAVRDDEVKDVIDIDAKSSRTQAMVNGKKMTLRELTSRNQLPYGTPIAAVDMRYFLIGEQSPPSNKTRGFKSRKKDKNAPISKVVIGVENKGIIIRSSEKVVSERKRRLIKDAEVYKSIYNSEDRELTKAIEVLKKQ